MALTRQLRNTRIIKPQGAFKALLLLLIYLSALPNTHADTTTQALTDDVFRPDCIGGLITEPATIERVTDGDTVVLADQRRVRLIGINAAELNARNPSLKAAAQQATKKLKAWLPQGEPVVLYIGDEPKDRHGRVLAHVIRASDGLAVAQLMVQSGLAVQSAVAPTTRCTMSFVKLENQAIEANRGLWKIRQLLSADATELTSNSRGFKLVSGTVTGVKRKKPHVQIFLDNQLQIKVRPTLAKQLPLQSLVGQTVEVRGWLSQKNNRPYLWLQHKANLSMLDNQMGH